MSINIQRTRFQYKQSQLNLSINTSLSPLQSFKPLSHSFYTQVKKVPPSPQRSQSIKKHPHLDFTPSACKKVILDPQSSKSTMRTELTHSTELKNIRRELIFQSSGKYMDYSLSQSCRTVNKRKTHFLTVVSRLPGMSKSSKKYCL